MRMWSTERLPEPEQFPFWRDVVWDAFVPVSLSRGDCGRFASSVSARSVGAIGVSRIASQPQSVARTPALIERRAGDVFFLNMPLSEGSSATQGGRTASPRKGDFVLVDGARPFQLHFRRPFRQISLILPHDSLAPLLAARCDATATTIPGDRGVGAVAAGAIKALATARGPFDRHAARALANQIAALVALAVGGLQPRAVSAGRALLLQAALDEIERSLGDPKIDEAALTKLRDRLEPLAQQLASFIASTAPKVDDLNQRAALLTPKTDGKTQDVLETPDSARLREQVTASRDAAVGLLAAANSLQVQAGQLATRIADRRRAVFTEKTFQQSPSIISLSMWETVVSTAPFFGGVLARTLLAWLRGLSAEMDTQKSFELLFAALLAFVVAWPGRRFICLFIRKAEARRPSSELGVAIEAALLAVAGTALPLVAATLFLDTIEELNLAPPRLFTLLEALLLAPAWVLAARTIVHAVLAPGAPRLRLVSTTEEGASTSLRFTTAAVATIGIATIFEAAAESVGAPISYSVAIKAVAALVLSALLVATLRRAAESDAEADAACLGPYVDPGGRLGGVARILGWGTAAMLTLAALLGYVAFAWFMAHQMLWAAALFATTTIVLAVINAVAAQMQGRDTAIARFAHLQMGLPERALEQAGALIGGVLKAATLALAVVLLLAPWGVESGNLVEALQGVIFGFSVAGVTISVTSLVVAAVLFAAGVFITHLLQRWLEAEFLPTTRIDAGLRNSIRTGVG
jgi:potassium-dependent mechanosensitive channel